ncbi:MAG: hypothetical protein U0271_46630 [Polyangiaceae bacterium]
MKPLDPSELVEPGAPLRPLAPTLDLGFTARAGMLAGIGDLPGPHLGAEAGIGLRIDEYEVSLTFEYAGGATARLTSRPDAGADFERIAGIARACRDLYPWSARPSAGAPFSLPLRADRGPFAVTVGACLGVELGEMAGQGFGVTYPERGEAFWAAPRFDVRGALNLVGPLSLSLDVGVAFPLDPRRFIITAADQSVLVVYTPAPAAGRLGLALQLDL